MDVREKLVELLKEISYDKKLSWYDLWDMRDGAEDIADLLIAHGVMVQEWISVKDRLPDVDGKYLVARAEGGRYSISVRKFRKEVPCWYKGYCGHWERRTNGITHWQYLPKPPKGE